MTQTVITQAIEWCHQSLDKIYPIVYLDGIVIKVRQDKQIIKKTMYIALGVNLEGKKECLGLWWNIKICNKLGYILLKSCNFYQ